MKYVIETTEVSKIYDGVVPVKAVDEAVFGHRSHGSAERLRHHLPAENARRAY